MDDEVDELEDRLKSIEYDNWRRNAPFLYDLEMIHTLLWPSLTVQWLPGKYEQDDDSDYNIQQCIVGTHTSGAAQNYLKIIEVAVPLEDLQDSDDEGSPRYVNKFEKLADKVTDHLKIPHEGEVNRARYLPQQQQADSFVIATKPPRPEVFIFDTKHHRAAGAEAGGEEHSGEQECQPDLLLAGHKEEGYALCWSHLREGFLLSGSDDANVCSWDINATPRDGRTINALALYKGHTAAVEDVAVHGFNPHIFGSVGDDGQLILWDTRKPPHQSALKAVKAHSREVYGLSFNPHNPHLLATCSSDTTVALRDWRNLGDPLHVLEAHTDELQLVSWCPQEPTVLASSGLDRRLMIWDISKIGAEQSQEDADDGPPELLFVHAGQGAKLQDFSWSPNDAWTVASVSDENTLQVWQVTEAIRSRAGNPG